VIRNISVVLSANSTSFVAQMRTASMAVSQFGDEAWDTATRTDTASRKTLDTVGKLSLALSAGLAVALGASVVVAAQFEKEMRNVASISPTVQKNFDSISDSLVDMSRQMPQSAKVLAQGLYDITSSGFDGAEAMTILKSSAIAASAGLTDTATSARAITAVLNAYGMEATEAGYVSDVLFGTVVKGVINFEDLAGVIGDTVGSAAAAGIEIDELGAAVATMTLSGISAAEAGTSLNRVMQSFIDPSETMIAHLKQQGYESGVAALESLGLQGAMEMLRVTTGGNVEVLTKLFPESRAARGALALMADSGQVAADVFGTLTDKTQVLGMTQAAYNIQSQSFSFQLEVAKNNVAGLAIDVGQKLLPALTSLIQTITGAFIAFSELPGPIKTVAAVLAGVVAVATAVGGAFLLLAPRIAAAQTVMASMASSSPMLASGLGMVTTAAGVLGAGLALLTVYLAINGKEKQKLAEISGNLVTALKAEASGTKGATDAAIAQELARKGLIAMAEKYGIALRDLIPAIRGDAEALERVRESSTATGDAKFKLTAGLAQVAEGFRKATSEVEAEEEALRAANPQLDEQRAKLAEVERILGPVADGLGKTAGKVKELDEIQKTYNDSMKEFADGGSVYKSVLSELQDAQQSENDAAIKGIDQRIAAIRSQKDLSEEAKDSQIAGLEEQKAALQDFTASAEISLSAYNEGLQKQIDAAKEWSANYVQIYREFGPQVATILASMGEEGRIIAAKMTEDITGEGKKTAELLPQLYGQAAIGATTQLFDGLTPSAPNTRKQVQDVSNAVTEVLSPLPGWTGDMARTLTNYLATQLDPAIPKTGQQARDTSEAFKASISLLPGWTRETADALVTLLAAGLDPMIGKTGQTAEETAEALRSRLATLPGFSQRAGSDTTDQWLVALGRGTGGTGAETAGWARALISVLNEILRGIGAEVIPENTGGAQRYAEGGIRERHEAQIAPAGAMRLWAEPETGGEAYIPLAEAKKHKSIPILRQVAEHFGMALHEYAYGGAVDDLGVPLPPTADGWGHMLGRTNADSDRFTYEKARAWVEEEKRKAAEKAAQGGGQPYSGGSIGSGWQQITGYLDSVGQAYTITSTYRAGDPGFHGRGKAVDMVGDMAAIFNTLAAGNPVPGINELFYDPMGYFYDEGARASGAIGGHDDHVHAATFDKGGILWPGYTLAFNGTGRPERVLANANGSISRSIVNTGQMSTSTQSTGATGAVRNVTNITSRPGAAGSSTPTSTYISTAPSSGSTYTAPSGNPGPYVYPAGNGLPGNMSIGPIGFGGSMFGPPGPFPGSNWAARTAYRLRTGDMSVEDENVNAYPDAWEPNGPPGAQMGIGGGSTSVDNSVNLNLHVDSDIHVAANADVDRVGILVRENTAKALQQFIDQLSRQLGKKVRVRI
jgi:TP901 family phage tail tape measure protein